jgi:hypothetical protein
VEYYDAVRKEGVSDSKSRVRWVGETYVGREDSCILSARLTEKKKRKRLVNFVG